MSNPDRIEVETLERLEADFRRVVDGYNEALRVGKTRAIRSAAETAHRVVWDVIQRLKKLNPEQGGLLVEAEAALTNIRWGAPVGERS